MAALTPADFAKFFTAIHGHAPFPWQQQLVEQLACKHQWPDVLDLPTGTGKTAALDAAVFHLALQQAVRPRRAALRIALVVDRRLVVDDAHRRAERIAGALADPSRVKTGRAVVREVARRLQRLAGDDAPPLVAVRLRGGAPLEDDWARTPTQPTILCSTVDQVGSRLLFRGYGVSDRMKPVHAGLLGEDCLILLDEAHLSQPFQKTLNAVRTIGDARTAAVVLTATPGRSYERPFRLRADDRRHQVLQQRLAAAKPAKLLKPIPHPDPAGTYMRTARDLAERLQRGGVAAPAVAVVVNRVDLARTIFNRLVEIEDAPFECLLLIGRSRAVDRRCIESKLDPFRTGNDKGRAEAKSLMVVATQCLEAGSRPRPGRPGDAGGPARCAAPALRAAQPRRPADRGVRSDPGRRRGPEEESRRSGLRSADPRDLEQAHRDRRQGSPRRLRRGDPRPATAPGQDRRGRARRPARQGAGADARLPRPGRRPHRRRPRIRMSGCSCMAPSGRRRKSRCCGAATSPAPTWRPPAP